MSDKPPFDYEKTAQALAQMTARAGGKLRGTSIAWFTAESWTRLLEVASDRWNLPDTFEEFERNATRRFDELVSRGHALERVVLTVEDVDALALWCRETGIPLDGHARATMAARKLAARDSKGGAA